MNGRPRAEDERAASDLPNRVLSSAVGAPARGMSQGMKLATAGSGGVAIPSCSAPAAWQASPCGRDGVRAPPPRGEHPPRRRPRGARDLPACAPGRARPARAPLRRAGAPRLPRCGILAHGFVRVHCDACGLDRLVPFSCKRRGFCPSCGGRRMADTAAHLVDCVLPEVPVRQWVLTLPYPLRYRCAYDAQAHERGAPRLPARALRRAAPARAGAVGARSRPVRCGHASSSASAPPSTSISTSTPWSLDGVYARTAGEPTQFLPLPPPSPREVARVLAGTARRITRLLEPQRRAATTTPSPDDEPLLATLAAASLRTRIATGPHAGQRWRRLGDRVEPAGCGRRRPEASRPRVRSTPA